jgi:hypothetical protein
VTRIPYRRGFLPVICQKERKIMPVFIILPLLETIVAVAAGTVVAKTISDLYDRVKRGGNPD